MTGAEGDGTIEDLVYEQPTQTLLSQEKNHVSGIDANPKRLVCGLYIYIYIYIYICIYIYISYKNKIVVLNDNTPHVLQSLD